MPALYPHLEALLPDEKRGSLTVEILEGRVRIHRKHPESASAWKQIQEIIRGHA